MTKIMSFFGIVSLIFWWKLHFLCNSDRMSFFSRFFDRECYFCDPSMETVSILRSFDINSTLFCDLLTEIADFLTEIALFYQDLLIDVVIFLWPFGKNHILSTIFWLNHALFAIFVYFFFTIFWWKWVFFTIFFGRRRFFLSDSVLNNF